MTIKDFKEIIKARKAVYIHTNTGVLVPLTKKQATEWAERSVELAAEHKEMSGVLWSVLFNDHGSWLTVGMATEFHGVQEVTP